MQRHIIYIINPVSGTSSKDAVQNIIAAETLKAGVKFKFMPSAADGNYNFIINDLYTQKITDVVIVGGDGTARQVINSLMHHQLQFGIIPCGSGNGLAFGAGISKNPHQALQTIFKNHTISVDGFMVNNSFACTLCGVGFDAKVAHDFAEQEQRGFITYVKQVFKNFFNARPYPFTIHLNNTTLNTAAYFISIANSNQFGNNFTIAPKASLHDGLLDVVIVTEQSKISVLYHTLMQINGLNKLETTDYINKTSGIIYFQTDAITIDNPAHAPMHLDGEPAKSAAKIAINIKEKCFKLLVDESD